MYVCIYIYVYNSLLHSANLLLSTGTRVRRRSFSAISTVLSPSMRTGQVPNLLLHLIYYCTVPNLLLDCT